MLRHKERKNYKEMADLRLPRARWSKVIEPLYSVDVVEKDEATGCVKVHYVGWGEECNKWKQKEEVLDLELSLDGELILY